MNQSSASAPPCRCRPRSCKWQPEGGRHIDGVLVVICRLVCYLILGGEMHDYSESSVRRRGGMGKLSGLGTDCVDQGSDCHAVTRKLGWAPSSWDIIQQTIDTQSANLGELRFAETSQPMVMVVTKSQNNYTRHYIIDLKHVGRSLTSLNYCLNCSTSELQVSASRMFHAPSTCSHRPRCW